MLRMSVLKLAKALGDEKKAEARAIAKAKKAKERSVANKANQKVASRAQFAPEFTTPPIRRTSDTGVCNVARYTPAELTAKMLQSSFDLQRLLAAPFIVRTEMGGGDDRANEDPLVLRLRTAWTAEILERDNKDVRVRYFNPVLAKAQREQDGPASETVAAAKEEFVPEDISFETFFKYCYGASKRPGTETEHCEQTLPAALLDNNITEHQFAFMRAPSPTSILGLRQRMEAVLVKTLEQHDVVDEIAPLLTSSKSDNGSALAEGFRTRQLAGLSSFMVLGPSGSGEQRRDAASVIDALVHGERRWFMMGEKELVRFLALAGSDFQPASAFVFFEDQLAALKEEWGLLVHLDDQQARTNTVWQVSAEFAPRSPPRARALSLPVSSARAVSVSSPRLRTNGAIFQTVAMLSNASQRTKRLPTAVAFERRDCNCEALLNRGLIPAPAAAPLLSSLDIPSLVLLRARPPTGGRACVGPHRSIGRHRPIPHPPLHTH